MANTNDALPTVEYDDGHRMTEGQKRLLGSTGGFRLVVHLGAALPPKKVLVRVLLILKFPYFTSYLIKMFLNE